MRDHAFAGTQHSFENFLFDVADEAVDHRRSQQDADLQRALDGPPGLDHVPAGIADHVRRGALQRQKRREHLSRCLADAVGVRSDPQGSAGAIGGGEHPPGVGRELIAHSLEGRPQA